MTDSQGLPFFAVCARGVEPATASELSRLGATAITPGVGGVNFSGDRATLYKACLWLRTATRVLRPLREFAAANADMLYAQTRRVVWEKILDSTKTFAVQATIKGSSRLARQGDAGGPGASQRGSGPGGPATGRQGERPQGRGGQGEQRQGGAPRGEISHTMFAALKIKDAIVDRLRHEQGSRPNVDRQNPDVIVHAHFEDARCTISLDATGASLHQRGYRDPQAEAPLKETLAAAIIELSGWDGRAPLVDPMCGSGTLVIEAALLSQRVAPGLFREQFAFERWSDHDAPLWKQLVEEAREAMLDEVPCRLLASDADARAVEAARKSARRAGVDEAIEFVVRPISEAAPGGDPGAAKTGVVVVNPPYGERLGNPAELVAVYRTLGATLRQHFGGWTAWVLTGNQDLAREIGISPAASKRLFNGAIECRLLKLDVPATTGGC
jgi:putative N6-adenine-specific DNA methylase